MWWHGEPIRRLLFGVDLQHNPLFTWLIIPLSALAGWDSMLVVTRAITIAATVLSGLVLAGLAQALYGSRLFSAIAANTSRPNSGSTYASQPRYRNRSSSVR
jgi:hypothetical protein